MKKLIIPLLASALLAGCADGNIHQFLNSDFLNATAPGIGNAGKMFYPERYNPLLPVKIPGSFGNEAPDHIGPWDFLQFTGSTSDNLYMANYYDPKSIRRNGSSVTVDMFSYYSNVQYTQSKKPYLSVVIKENVDCNKRMVKYLYGTAYSGTRAVGTPVSKSDFSQSSKFRSIDNGSLEEVLYNKVCP